MADIKLSAEELRTQANKMTALKEQYTSLFQSINNEMNTINSNWSSLLANNFAGKISSVTKSFENITGMLETGSRAAKISADSYENVDKALAKLMLGEADSKEILNDIDNQINNISKEFRKMGKVKGLDAASNYSVDPVNLCNGNFIYDKECLVLDGAVPMSVHLFYNSNDDEETSVGTGWMLNFQVCLIKENDIIQVKKTDSSLYQFVNDGNGKFVACDGTFAYIKKDGDYYKLVDEDNYIWLFDTTGKLISQKDLGGEGYNVSYNALQQINHVSDNMGNCYAFTYNEDNKIIRIEDQNERLLELQYDHSMLSEIRMNGGRKWKFEYDFSGKLCEVINSKGISEVKNIYDGTGRTIQQEFPDGGTISYVYDQKENCVVYKEQNGNTVQYYHDELYRNVRNVYENGEEVFTYNDQNQRTSFTDRNGHKSLYTYNENGKLTKFENALGYNMAFQYNQMGQIEKYIVNGDVLCSVIYDERNRQKESVDANQGKCCFNYDEKDHMTGIVYPDGAKVSMKYDELGRMTSITNFMGGETEYFYDKLNRITASIDPKGYETKYYYNSADEIIKVEKPDGNSVQYFYDSCGNMVKNIDEQGNVLEIQYNTMNKPCKYIDAEGNETTWEYDHMWNVTKRTDANGGESRFSYDQYQNLIEIQDANGGIQKAFYDPCGNLIKRIDAEKGVYELAYDALNRPVKTIDSMGNVVEAEYDERGYVSLVRYSDGTECVLQYDKMGNCIYKKDRTGYENFYKYNALNLISEISDKTGWLEKREYYPGGLLKKETHINGESNSYEYDPNEKLVSVITQDEVKYGLEYDAVGNIVQIQKNGVLLEKYVYDALGNVITVTNAEGEKKHFKYSANGKLIHSTDELGFATQYNYDCMGNLVCMMQENRIDIDRLNEFNQKNEHITRVSRYQWDLMGNLISSIDPAGQKETYQYDKCGRLIEKVDENNNKTVFEYYPNGLDKKRIYSDGRTVMMEYDALDQLIKLEDWTGQTFIHRNRNGKPESVEYPNGDKVQYRWNERGACTGLTYPDGSEIRYSYDMAGNLSKLQMGDEAIRYGYDTNGRLREKLYPHHYKTEYSYNALGVLEQLQHKKDDNIVTGLRYTYDALGRIKQLEKTGLPENQSNLYQYCYDARGSITDVLCNEKRVEHYEYDAFGNRTCSVNSFGTAQYHYNNLDQLIYMEDSDGKHDFRYDAAGNMLGELINGKEHTRFSYDAAGLLRQAITEQGSSDYICNSFGYRVSEHTRFVDGRESSQQFQYDYTKNYNNALTAVESGCSHNYIWDNMLVAQKTDKSIFIMHDEKMSPLFEFDRDHCYEGSLYDTFGNTLRQGQQGVQFGFCGYQKDRLTGLEHVGIREYSAKAGRFLSRDVVPGTMVTSLSVNSYLYCRNDAENYTDPTGEIPVPIATGIVGAVINEGSLLIGDAVTSYKNGKLTLSPWEKHVGKVAGGFVQGALIATPQGAIAGGAVAGAAGGATETFVTNGLSKLFGEKGYTKKSGYTMWNLFGDTLNSGVEGAIDGFVLGKVGKYIKIPTVTKGRGNWNAVFRMLVTKSQEGIVHNMALKTFAKGLVTYGIIGMTEKFIDKGTEAVREKNSQQIWKYIESLFSRKKTEKTTVTVKKVMAGNRQSITCSAAG